MSQAELNPVLKQAIESGMPVKLVDPDTQQVYYVISAEQYQQVHATLSGHFNPREAYPLIDKAMAEDDAQDPLLESYQ
ncbi:MAG: hypothetical protein K8T25_10305 [Planctomycetia bacterium]|nr:hypothetical protein [Planctomycetia bacterium]